MPGLELCKSVSKVELSFEGCSIEEEGQETQRCNHFQWGYNSKFSSQPSNAADLGLLNTCT